jgi:hypothetical protein
VIVNAELNKTALFIKAKPKYEILYVPNNLSHKGRNVLYAKYSQIYLSFTYVNMKWIKMLW